MNNIVLSVTASSVLAAACGLAWNLAVPVPVRTHLPLPCYKLEDAASCSINKLAYPELNSPLRTGGTPFETKAGTEISEPTPPSLLEHPFTRATAVEACEFLQTLSEMERVQPGSAANLLNPAHITLSPGTLTAYAHVLFPPTEVRTGMDGYLLPESMEASMRKALNADQNAENAGAALAQRWAQEPTIELRESMESVGNPWFLAATAAYGRRTGDVQMVQQALSRLETTPGAFTVSALIVMADEETAPLTDIADTVHHWAERHSSTPGLTEYLAGMLADASSPNASVLLAVSLAGAGDRPKAEAALLALAQNSPANEQAVIQYARELLRPTP